MITNGPMDVTACSGGSVSISCGFTGISPLTSLLNWRIIRRSDDGSVTSDETISVDDIISDTDDGLVWRPDTDTGGNNASNSVLVVGPVDESHNQSSYQCFLNDVESSIGTLTVLGEYIVHAKIIYRVMPHVLEDRLESNMLKNLPKMLPGISQIIHLLHSYYACIMLLSCQQLLALSWKF